MSTHIDSPYTPLSWYTGQFRVLLLEPGQYDAEIRIQLIPAWHGRLSWYEALSYVWGTELAPTPVVVNGKSRMAITENLDCALRHLRQPDEIRRLWVDAICINQQDIDERNDQVKRMAQIYSQSHRTIIWLGPDQGYNYENLLSFVERQVQPGPKDCYTQSEIIDELNKIVRRPWFSRLWVLQEIIMSKLDPMVYIGHFRIPWSVFESGASFFFDSYIESEDGDSALGWECLAEGEKVKSLARLRADGRHASLEFRLYDSRFQTATDPRDQIYGILGISDVKKGLLEPDYRLPVHTVFTKTVVVLIEHYSPMFYTIYPLRCETKGVSGLPSWVPDLSIPAKWEAFKSYQHRQPSPAGMLRGRNIFSTMSPFFAREKFPCIARFSEDYRTMFAIGRPLGIVTWASVPDQYFDPGAERRLYDLYHTSAKHWGYTPTIFHKALYDVRHLYTVPSHFRHFEEFLERDSVMEDFHPEFKDLLRDTLRSASYRTIFATDTGRFGQSYHPEQGGIRAGDVLVGLFGIDFPFILRSMGSERYEIVNVAYVVDYEWRKLPPIIEFSEQGSWRDLESFELRVYEIA